MSLPAYEKILGELLPHEIGRRVSVRERRELNKFDDKSLTYGEIGFEATSAILKKLPEKDTFETLADFGSGTGKVVFAAALLYPFKHIVGIEILEGLHQLSEHVRKGSGLSAVDQFVLGDFLTVDVAPDVVIIHCACFSEKLIKRLVKRLAQILKGGAVVATVSVQLPQAAGFELLDTLIHSLGDDDRGENKAIIFIQRYAPTTPQVC